MARPPFRSVAPDHRAVQGHQNQLHQASHSCFFFWLEYYHLTVAIGSSRPPGTTTDNARSVASSIVSIDASDQHLPHISHYHGDHIGQANSLPKATLLIGKGDWDVLTSPKPPTGVNPQLVSHWISNGGAVEPVLLDKDVFGDGTVIMM